MTPTTPPTPVNAICLNPEVIADKQDVTFTASVNVRPAIWTLYGDGVALQTASVGNDNKITFNHVADPKVDYLVTVVGETNEPTNCVKYRVDSGVIEYILDIFLPLILQSEGNYYPYYPGLQ
jgi:hypothetical protein